jgi:hypothetical protein
MNIALLFVVVGFILVLLIARYEKTNNKKVNDILRANKNVPPLFMLRSAELKVNAIKSALNNSSSGIDDIRTERISAQLDKLVSDYKNREIPLTVYYSKLGALLIQVNELKGALVEVGVS